MLMLTKISVANNDNNHFDQGLLPSCPPPPTVVQGPEVSDVGGHHYSSRHCHVWWWLGVCDDNANIWAIMLSRIIISIVKCSIPHTHPLHPSRNSSMNNGALYIHLRWRLYTPYGALYLETSMYRGIPLYHPEITFPIPSIQSDVYALRCYAHLRSEMAFSYLSNL